MFEEFWIYCMLRIFFWDKETSHFVQKISRPLDRPVRTLSAFYLLCTERSRKSCTRNRVMVVCVCALVHLVRILFMSHSLTSCINSNHQKRDINGIQRSNMISCNVARRGKSWQVVARRVNEATLFDSSQALVHPGWLDTNLKDLKGHISQPAQ